MSISSFENGERALRVVDDDAAVLRAWASEAGSGPVAARRARIVLLCAQGLGTAAVAAEVGCAKQTVVTWRERYRSGGIAALGDAPRPGRPVSVDEAVVIARTVEGPAESLGLGRWSTRTLAAELGISNGTVAAIWRAWGIRPGERGVLLRTRPALEPAGRALVGVVVEPGVRILGLGGVADGGARPEPAETPAELPDLAVRLSRLRTEGSEGRPDPDAGARAVEAVVRGGADRLVLDSGVPVPPVGAPGVSVGGAAAGGASVHVVDPGTWERAAHVAAVAAALAGHRPLDLVAALDDHLAGPGGPFRWIRPATVQ